jgi:hypothetical protein|tara:strand:- start:1152 stop:1271 length:120 start_codon:yes stop_codon:yes gene_type:complete
MAKKGGLDRKGGTMETIIQIILLGVIAFGFTMALYGKDI